MIDLKNGTFELWRLVANEYSDGYEFKSSMKVAATSITALVEEINDCGCYLGSNRAARVDLIRVEGRDFSTIGTVLEFPKSTITVGKLKKLLV